MEKKFQDLETYQANQEFIDALSSAVKHVYFDRMTRLLYSTDASIYQMMPVGVALPRDKDEVMAAVETAAHHGVPILPRGGGSSLIGQAIGHALILDLSRYMDQIIEIDAENKYVRTQPGVTLGALNDRLRSYGLMYGPDPASGDRATMGGILGNNSTGSHSIIYGMTDKHVLSTEVVLADASKVIFELEENATWQSLRGRAGKEGEIYRALYDILKRNAEQIRTRYPKTFRHVAGYNLHLLDKNSTPNLARLIVGSEGTLGVITQTTLNLVTIPKKTRLAIVHFDELRSAMEAVPTLLESNPTAVEVLDKMMLDLTRDKIEYRRLLTFVQGDPKIILLVEYTGDSEHELNSCIQNLNGKLAKLNHKGSVLIISDLQEQANVWYVRKVGLGILMSIRGDAKPIPFIEDAAVPVEHLADYVSQIYDYAYSTGVDKVAMYAHASAGCIHIRPLVSLKSPDGVRQLRQIAEKSIDLVVSFGGTSSGEHGEGIARAEFSERLFGPELVQAFHEVKQIFDPDNLLNPGKIVNAPRMDSENLLRFGTEYRVPHALENSAFHFIEDGSFAAAVEMCNGAGVCRKLGQGVMCPSFQATQDEKHSTRGRANALRSAMMGLLGPEGMTSAELYDVLDLCLSCHACRSECPSAVDMAKLKAEFLYSYHKKHGTPLRSRIFGNIASLNRFGQRLAGLSNALLDIPGKWVMTQVGIHPERTLPKFAKQPFTQWYRQDHGGSNPGDRDRSVVFFHDTFMEHNHPEIGQAAVRVLEMCGYNPIILQDKRCCGRPAVSKGLLEEAKELAQHNISILAPYAHQDIPIVGCEPSCMAMFVDEYPDFWPGEDSSIIAELSMPLDAFLVREAEVGRLGDLQFDDQPRRILFHGHCQQKASFGTLSTHALLSMIPNCQVEEIDAGCCGMAGSFGYEQEHYDLSIQIAELELAPRIRNAPEELIICASGSSCRDQIEHTTSRQALHPIQIFNEALLSRCRD